MGNQSRSQVEQHFDVLVQRRFEEGVRKLERRVKSEAKKVAKQASKLLTVDSSTEA